MGRPSLLCKLPAFFNLTKVIRHFKFLWGGGVKYVNNKHSEFKDLWGLKYVTIEHTIEY